MARAKVISQLVAGSQPSLSVTGRADGGGYTVTAGARSLSITAEAGATLLTTVKDQDNASITVTDSTSTTPSWTAPGGGTTGADYCVQVTATRGGYTEQVSFSELVDGSGGGGGGSAGLSAILDIDWPALFAASGAYDFLTTGGSGGTGGDGTHSYGGYSFLLNGTTGGLTQLEVTANGLEATQTSGAFTLSVDLRALTPALDPSALCRCIGIWASAVSTGAGDGVQVGLRRNVSIGTWEVGDTVIRYRQADATPDLYGISYNGSTYDVLPSSTLTASNDVRMQVDLDNNRGAVVRGDTGTSTDPADSDTLGEFGRVSYATSYAAFSGTYPGDTSYWALVGIGGNASGTCTRLIVYGLEA